MNKPARVVSPASPTFSLEDALDDAKKLYDTFSHAGFSKAEIASTLGISAASSALSNRLTTLTQYGLIADAGAGHMKVTDHFHKLRTSTPGSAEFKSAAFETVRRSGIFRELLDDFKTKLPERDVVAQRLETQKRFLADKAKSTAGVLERSLIFAGVLDANRNIVPARSPIVTGKPQEKVEADALEDAVGLAGGAGGEHAEGPKARRTEVPLTSGRVAIVAYPHDLNPDEADKVGRVLKALVT